MYEQEKREYGNTTFDNFPQQIIVLTIINKFIFNETDRIYSPFGSNHKILIQF